MFEIKEKITYQNSGIILKTMDLREKDKLVVIYTSDFGKIQAKAIGAKKISSKMAGHLEPITESFFAFAKGKNLDTIIGAIAINNFSEIKKKLELQAAVYYILELVDEFTEFLFPDEKIYSLLKKTLKRMNNLSFNDNEAEATPLRLQGKCNFESGIPECRFRQTKTLLRFFEIKLLKYLGFQPELDCCAVCQKKIKPQKNYLSGKLGGIICPICRKNDFSSKPISAEAIKVLKFFNQSSFVFAKKLKIEKKLEKELENLNIYFLEFILEKEIKSKDFLNKVFKNCE
jgi:DNA repair protein RecO (recombination protein O)